MEIGLTKEFERQDKFDFVSVLKDLRSGLVIPESFTDLSGIDMSLLVPK